MVDVHCPHSIANNAKSQLLKTWIWNNGFEFLDYKSRLPPGIQSKLTQQMLEN
jgi:hypothetical protein